jgi:hypothetical protein
MAETAKIVAALVVARTGDDKAALADVEIERRVYFGIVELHHDVGAGDAEMRGAERDECRHVEGTDADHVELVVIGAKTKLAIVGIVERGLELDPGTAHQRHRLRKEASLGQRQNQPLIRAQRPNS